MRRLRISGIVRTANEVRRVLTDPITPAERDALSERLQDSIRQIELLFDEHEATARNLPNPSRRAYQFLKKVDLNDIRVVDSSLSAERVPRRRIESVTFGGLRAFLDRVLDDVARLVNAGRFNPQATLEVIRQTASRLDRHIEREGLEPEHLRPQARRLVGWFRYFARDEALVRYGQAVGRAQGVLVTLPDPRRQWRPPLFVHFRPVNLIYRWSFIPHGTRITLPTPMIVFNEETVRALGRQMLGHDGARSDVTAAIMAEPYQTIAAELEASGGMVEYTRGLHHDLAVLFDHINDRYFNGQLARPRLRWSRTLTSRTFGHYNFVDDTVMISTTLDQPGVPHCAIEHVMHHELLHKKHGLHPRGNHHHAHTAPFRAEEHTFEQYEEAVRVLNQLAW